MCGGLSAADDVLEEITADSGDTARLTATLAEGDAPLDAVHQPGEGQALQIYFAWSGHLCQEEPLTAEECIGEPTYELDVVVHRGSKRDDTAGIHPQGLTRPKVLLDDGPAGMDEDHPVPRQSLQDEALTAKEAGAHPLGEGHFDLSAASRTQERVLLAQYLAVETVKVESHDLSWVGSSKSHVALTARVVHKGGDEETLAGDQAFETCEQAAACTGLHFDTVFHVGHCAYFCAHTLAWVEFNFNELQVVSIDFMIDNISHTYTSWGLVRIDLVLSYKYWVVQVFMERTC